MAGIYIHIPFCKQRCTYCDFHFSTNTSYTGQMVEALCKEIHLRKKELGNESIETIYFGGGTPSILEHTLIGKIFTVLKREFDLSTCKEITLEANPDDISAEKVQFWKSLGINRLSIGVQSFDEFDLKWMNRAHNATESLNSIRIAQEYGIPNLTIDLIYGLPEMSLERWEKQIRKAISLGVQHLSCYCLTVEEKTALYQKVKKQELIPADQDMQNVQFDLLMQIMHENGFIHYEISNFGKPNFIALHNSNYWNGHKYIGIGPSAHSFDGKNRSWNIRSNHIYMNQIKEGKLPHQIETLTDQNRFNELLMTGLRTIWGVDLQQLASILPLKTSFQDQKDKFIQKGWMIESENKLTLTNAGQHFADAIASDLFEV